MRSFLLTIAAFLACAIIIASVGLCACHADPSIVTQSCASDASEDVLDAGIDAPESAADVDAGPCTAELYMHDFAEAMGARVVSCCTAVGVTVDPEHAEYVYEAGWLGQSFAGVAGRACSVGFDAAKGADCLAKASAMTCQDISEHDYNIITAACFGVFTGLIADGSPCEVSVQCGASSFCDHTAGDAGAGFGLCAPLAAEGAPCIAFNPAHEFSCSHLGNGRACVGGVCIPLRAAGASIQTSPLECAAGMLNGSFVCADVIPIATFPNLTAGICSIL